MLQDIEQKLAEIEKYKNTWGDNITLLHSRIREERALIEARRENAPQDAKNALDSMEKNCKKLKKHIKTLQDKIKEAEEEINKLRNLEPNECLKILGEKEIGLIGSIFKGKDK